ncbi:MAG: ImmA/IrrE family metallo-endopeptidase [Rhodobacteraceae bacterium]|nr:ImmA/IrrE family metallo-endopeptidase [Paracoccaceae bacterium]
MFTRFSKPKPASGRANYLAVRSAISKLRADGYLSSVPVDPEKIAEDLGIEVVFANFDDSVADDISGFIDFEVTNDNDSKFKAQIVVNSETSVRRQLFTIAHELGHFLMHRDWAESENYVVLPRSNNYFESSKPAEEIEADAFAADLLVPLSELEKVYKHYDLVELADLFMVSEEVISYRIKALKRYLSAY